ncbi:hypothetical protein L1D21_02970 [Shewanella sp. Isolate11]|nr:hypothetical protein [Shewanella sp. Isolate11]
MISQSPHGRACGVPKACLHTRSPQVIDCHEGTLSNTLSKKGCANRDLANNKNAKPSFQGQSTMPLQK